MHVAHHDQVAFPRMGRLSAGALEPVEERGLLPALFAPYRNLAALRHDFPLVLTPGASARSLSGLFDAAVAACNGVQDARLRGHARRMEDALRRLVAAGTADGLAAAWEVAAPRLAGADPALGDSLDRLRPALPRDGALVGCDRQLPARLLTHEWNECQRGRVERLGTAIAALATRLEDILKANLAASPAGHSPERLRAAMDKVQAGTFDFGAMARLLARSGAVGELGEARCRRIGWLLTVLRTQRFAPVPGSRATRYGFAFASCGAALRAWRERLPAVAELAKAMAMARLEVAGNYNEAMHDPLFAGFGAEQVDDALVADLPDYLVCIDGPALTPEESACIVRALGGGRPFKVLVQTDDLLEAGGDMGALGLRVRPLVATALGLGDVHVLQAGASQLFSQLTRVRAGVAHAGPALFSVYSGDAPASAAMAPYLMSAAAVESRAFPGFAYDPAAGPDWASRFSLDGNPQTGRDWPLHALGWKDAALRRQGAPVAFTLVDFLACDRRAAPHLARVASEAWSGALVPVSEALAEPRVDPATRLPCLIMADADERLHKVVADEVLLHEARRCLGRWRVLQELAGINNSHVARQVNAAGLAWEAPPRPDAAAPAAAREAEAETERTTGLPSPGLPSIETPHGGGCIGIDGDMPGDHGPRQPAVIDTTARHFRQVMEAAEGRKAATAPAP